MTQLIKQFFIGLIVLYQKTLSPDHGLFRARFPHGFCRFYPSCSEYAKQAVDRYGVITGLSMGVKRVLRCNPWTEPQVDLID